MKHLGISIIILLIHTRVFSQGVGINTKTPDPSAALDITNPAGVNKGVLVPKVFLQSVTDNTTITSPANSLLIWNTNPNLAGGVGFYCNESTVVGNAIWTCLSKQFRLPFYEGNNSITPLFQIDNYNGSTTSAAIKGYAAGNGTGIIAQSSTGVALSVNGLLKITGNGSVPGTGKILTSDENGGATWEGAVALRTNGILSGGSEKIASNILTNLAFTTEEYDLSNSFNGLEAAPANTFTVPTKGIYHFDVQVSWGKSSGTIEQLIFEHAIYLKKTKNGNTSTVAANEVQTYNQNSNQISVDLLLEPGDQIHAAFIHHFGDYLYLRLGSSAFNYFSGRLVTKL